MDLDDPDSGIVSIIGDTGLERTDPNDVKNAVGQLPDTFNDHFLLVAGEKKLTEIDFGPTHITRTTEIIRLFGRDLRHQLERSPETHLGGNGIARLPLCVPDPTKRAGEPTTKTRVG